MTADHSTSQPRTRSSSPYASPNTISHDHATSVVSNGTGDGSARLQPGKFEPTLTLSGGSRKNERGRIRSPDSLQPNDNMNDSQDSHYIHGQQDMHDSSGRGQRNEEHGLHVEKRRRTAGGFLLPSALRHGSGTLRRRKQDDGHVKGKEKASHVAHTQLSGSLSTTPSSLNGSPMRSSPLAQVVVSHRQPGDADGTRSRPSTEMDSRPLSAASSSQPRASSEYTLGTDGSVFGQTHGGIDPAQIVNMALNLSESRRRHISAGQLLQQQAGGARRSASVAVPSPGMMQGSFQNAGTGVGGSMRQALNQQKGRSRNNSPGSTGKGTPKRHTSNSMPFLSPDAAGQDMFYRFTPSTLARAEKARQYIELSVEYRRLLDYLPPLRPDAMASGNYEYITHSVPGSPFVELVRSPTTGKNEKHELGRQYNPLQMIRNRKLRMRNRLHLKPDVDQFSDTNTVRDWIDEVQQTVSRKGYRTEDRVHLPLYPEDETRPVQNHEIPVHQRTESTTKPKRQRSDWSFQPSEHIADAYWMEQDANKRLIENHNGNRILPPLALGSEASQPRASYESRRSNRSFRGSVETGTSAGSHEAIAPDTDSEGESARAHRHRHLHRPHLHPHSRDNSRGRLKQVLKRARRKSRSSSSNLSSSDEGPMGEHTRRKQGSLRITSGGHNIGALQKHLESRLNTDEHEKSPDLTSPGTPNKWGTAPGQISSLQREANARAGRTDPDHIPIDSAAIDYARQDRRLTPGSGVDPGGRFESSRSSFEDSSTTANSPVVNPHRPSVSVEVSPDGSRAASPSRLGKPLLPFIHKEQKRQRKHSSTDDGYQSSRQTSAEVTSNTRGSLDLPRVVAATPERTKLHRHKTSDGITEPIGQSRDTKDSKDPQSAVRRFFKGGRIGEIVRNESSLRGRKRGSVPDLTEIGNPDTDSMEESDTEETDANADSRPSTMLQRSNTGWSAKYTSDKLPSFRSTKTNGHGRKGSIDHISKQQRELSQNRSSRFDKLAPPGLDLSRIHSSSSNFADVSRQTTQTSESPMERRNANGFAQQNRNRSRLGNRLEAILDVPGTVGTGGLPVTGLADFSNQKPPARPGMEDKRQWSISDRHRSQSRDPRVPSLDYFDIARVRALLMCSGIKASIITTRSDEVRSPVPDFLLKAAEMCRAEVRLVKRSEEHVLAAQLLTNHLEMETSALHDDADDFLQHKAADLKKELGVIRDTVDAAIKNAQTLGDACIGFGSEVTGQRTLQVRQVVDQLDKLARARRRRLRWLRRLGFGLGEWFVVLVLWTAWFFVVILKTIIRTVKGVGCAVKWVLWL